MPSAYTTPDHLGPVEIWRLRFATGEIATATLAPTAAYCGVVWYLDEDLQDAAQFTDGAAAIAWAVDVRRMLSSEKWPARVAGPRRGATGVPTRNAHDPRTHLA
jgi:hypothetical protein